MRRIATIVVSTALVLALALVVVVVVGGRMRASGSDGAASDAAAAEPAASTPTTPTTAPASTTSTEPDVVAGEVVYVGDSITDMARGRIEADLGADPAAIRAVGGFRIEDMQYAATALLPLRPEQVVINLGTNNVLQDDSTDHAAAALEAMVGVFDHARCIHLVTINETMLAPPKDVHGGAVRLNERMHQLAASDPRVHVVEWAQLLAEHDHPGDPAWPMTTDNVHPTPTGQQVLLDAYRQSIDACGGTVGSTAG